jgi:3D (Asp-Asp-Asp) domain-containing protein
VVQDRMNPKFNNRVDVWFGDTKEAIDFGVKTAFIEIF